MFRSCQSIIRELCSLLKLYYGIQIQFLFSNEVLWQHIMLCCGAVARCASYDAHLATVPQHIITEHLVCKYELNCEYCNIISARNKATWWWSEKMETCRSVLKCFMWNYMFIRWLINRSNSHPSFRPPNGITSELKRILNSNNLFQ